MSYDLSINGTSKTLEQWGFSEAILTETSRAASELKLTANSADATQAMLLAGDAVSLSQDGVTVWSGECVSDGAGLTGQSETVDYRCVGPWLFLDRLIYLQKVLDPEADPIAPVDPVEWTSEVILFQDESAARSTTMDQLADILSQTSRLSLGDTSTVTDLDPIGETAKSITLAEAIQRVLAWHPRSVTRENPDATLDVFESFAAYDLPLADVAQTLTITPRPDLRLRGVVLTYNNCYQETPASPSQVVDSAGETSGENIARLEYNLGGVSIPPEGIAARWFAQFEAIQYEVSFSLVGVPTLGQWLGRAINVSGSPWAAINSPVQRATYDLFAETTAINAGPLPTYAIDDLIELLRLRKYTSAQDGSRVGTERFTPESPGEPFSSYRVAEDTFRISPGFVGAVPLSNPDDEYDGNGLIWLEVTVDANGGPTAVTADSGASLPPPTPTMAIIPLHAYSTEAGEIIVNDGRTGNMPFLSIGTATGHYWD